jgi:hypothetical protein
VGVVGDALTLHLQQVLHLQGGAGGAGMKNM